VLRGPLTITDKSDGGAAEASAVERKLVERAKTGERDAFRSIYEDNVGVVFAFLRRRVGVQEAEDLTADTFCRAYEHLPRFEWRGIPVRAWLLRIAYHLVVARSRRRDTNTVPVEDPPAAAAPTHEDDVIAGLDNDRVLGALSELSSAHRTVLELRYLGQLSVAETALVLGSSEQAIRALSYRALKALRAAHFRPAQDGD
jgi:RNA polymerase sigma-70 factor (ECF subfamily)